MNKWDLIAVIFAQNASDSAAFCKTRRKCCDYDIGKDVKAAKKNDE